MSVPTGARCCNRLARCSWGEALVPLWAEVQVLERDPVLQPPLAQEWVPALAAWAGRVLPAALLQVLARMPEHCGLAPDKCW